MNLEKIKEDLTKYLNDKGFKLFEASYQKNDSIFSILLDNKLNMEEIEKISEELSVFMDKYDEDFPQNYFLDVSCVGAEKPIRNIEELNNAIGEYIFVKTKDKECYGVLKCFENNILTLLTKDKNRDKQVMIDYADVKKVRYAVKF